MLLSEGSLSIVWSNALVGGVSTLAVAMLLWPLWGMLKSRMGGAGVPPRAA